MRLKRTYEMAEEEGKDIEEVALERFGSLEAFNELVEERRILDERAGKKSQSQSRQYDSGKGQGGSRSENRYAFTDLSGPPSRDSFRKPGENKNGDNKPANKRLDSLRASSGVSTPRDQKSQTAQSTPIPSVLTPRLPSSPPVDLNKLQAKVLRAKLMGAANAQELEQEYEEAKRRSEGIFTSEGKKLEVLPTMDARGQLYDVGSNKQDEPGKQLPGNRRKKEKVMSYFLLCCAIF